jgi:lycopene cyclase domain-containing protein
MTYFAFLLRFLALPLAVLLIITLVDLRRGKTAPAFLSGSAVWIAIGLHVLLAVIYTTPWDNYLVATGVWYYDPALISGILLGWVPIEEYAFFVLETILVGLWWWFLARRLKPPAAFQPSRNIRLLSAALLGAVWLCSLFGLFSGWKPGEYLSLILIWALPPMLLQLAFGADILWHDRRLLALAVLPVFLYLSAADSLAISSGTWTIDPARSTGIFIGGLPIEEAAFFLSTVVLIGFGLTLSLSRLSQARWMTWVRRLLGAGDDQPSCRQTGIQGRGGQVVKVRDF